MLSAAGTALCAGVAACATAVIAVDADLHDPDALAPDPGRRSPVDHDLSSQRRAGSTPRTARDRHARRRSSSDPAERPDADVSSRRPRSGRAARVSFLANLFAPCRGRFRCASRCDPSSPISKGWHAPSAQDASQAAGHDWRRRSHPECRDGRNRRGDSGAKIAVLPPRRPIIGFQRTDCRLPTTSRTLRRRPSRPRHRRMRLRRLRLHPSCLAEPLRQGRRRSKDAESCRQTHPAEWFGFLVRAALQRPQDRERRDLRPARADGRTSLAAVRDTGPGRRPGYGSFGHRADQRSRPLCAWTRHRPVAASAEALGMHGLARVKLVSAE